MSRRTPCRTPPVVVLRHERKTLIQWPLDTNQDRGRDQEQLEHWALEVNWGLRVVLRQYFWFTQVHVIYFSICFYFTVTDFLF